MDTIIAGRRALLGLLLASAAPALAQTDGASVGAEENTGSDIIVTAERREERIQDVPIAVSVLSAQELLARSVENVGDAISVAPNVARTGGANGRGDANFYVRGVGQIDNSVTVDPGVGVYVDEVYLSRIQGASFDLFDIERIEVLRGPQGTLWGKNTIGGAISIVTRDPTPGEWSGRGRLLYGSRDRFEGFATVNIPMGENGAMSVTGLVRSQDGWARNVYSGETQGDVRTEGLRIKLKADLTDRLSIRLSGDYIHDHGTPVNQVLLNFDPSILRPVFLSPRPGVPPIPAGVRPGLSPTGVAFPADVAADRGDRRTSFNSIPLLDTIKNGGVHATISWDFSDLASLKSITAYRELNRRVWNDFDGTGYRLYDSFNRINQEQFSQEFHLTGSGFEDRLNYVVGLFYLQEKAANLVELCTGTNGPRLTGACLNTINPIRINVDSYAAFTNVQYKLTDQLQLSAGLRYTYEERDQFFSSRLDNTQRGGVTGIGAPIFRIPRGTSLVQLPPSAVSADFDAWTPKVSLDWKVAEDALVYASYARGFKAGGFTGRPSQALITAYDPETIDTFELGTKLTLQRGLFLNFAAFQSDYEDIQLLFQIPPGLFDTTNAGSARIRGWEAELLGRVTPRFGVNASVGFLDAQYTRIDPRVSGVSLNDRLPLVSKWQVSLGAQYDLPITATSEFTMRADVNYRSRFSYQLENDPFEIQPGFTTVNLRGQYSFADGRYSLAVIGLNVFDEKYFLNMNDGSRSNSIAVGIPARPAEWAVEFQARF